MDILMERKAETPIISWLTPHEHQRELFRNTGVQIVAPHLPRKYYEKERNPFLKILMLGEA